MSTQPRQNHVTFTVTESVQLSGRKISGVLAIPRFSLNGNVYMPEELARGNNKIVPLYADHAWKYGKTDAERKPVGAMYLEWDAKSQQLTYDALIEDDDFARFVAENKDRLGASLGAKFASFDRLCGIERCYRVLRQLDFIEGSITPKPSMPETKGSIVVLESVHLEDDEEPTDDNPEQDKSSDDDENPDKKPGDEKDHHCAQCRARSSKNKAAKASQAEALFKVAFDSKILTFAEGSDGNLNVTGILAVPRMNLNGSCLMPEALAKGHGLTIPMSVNHDMSFDNSIPPVGSMSLRWNVDKLQLEYDGIVTDKQAIADVKSGKFKHTSISVEFGFADFDYVAGWFLIKNITRFVEGSLVEYPAIPEATVVALESINTKLAGRSDVKEIRNIVLAQQLTIRKVIATSTINSLDSAKGNDSQNMSSSTETQKPNANQTSGAGAAGSGAAAPAQPPVNVISLADAMALIQKQQEGVNLVLESVKASNEEIKNFAKAVVEAQSKKSESSSEKKPTARMTGKAGFDASVKIENLKFQALAEALRETHTTDPLMVKQKMDQMIATEAIDLTAVGTAAGGYWTADITSIPDKLIANLRDTCDVKVIDKGAKDIHFTLMARPAFGSLSPPTVPGDYNMTTYPIDDLVATPTVRGVKQTITDQAMNSATPDFMSKLQGLFQEAAIVDMDNLVMTELDAISTSAFAGRLFGDESVAAESSVTASMTFAAARITSAIRKLGEAGYAVRPGDAICILAAKQMADLFQDAILKNAISYGTIGTGNVQVPMLYGVELRIAPVPTGKGSPTTVTTYHAYVYLKQVAVGLGFTGELTIEVGRVVGELGTRVVASYQGAAKAKKPSGTNAKISVVQIITA